MVAILSFVRRAPHGTRPPCLALAAAVLLFAPSGCAYRDVTIHPPSAGDLVSPSNAGRGRGVVLVGPFADTREAPPPWVDPPLLRRVWSQNGVSAGGTCGFKLAPYKSYMLHTADVLCSMPVGTWVASALADGLRSSGFRVVDAAEGAPVGTPRIGGEVSKFFIKPTPPDPFSLESTPATDLTVTLHLTMPSGRSIDRTFSMNGGDPALVFYDSDYQASVEQATRGAVLEMVGAIVEALARDPQPGAGAAPVAVSTGADVKL